MWGAVRADEWRYCCNIAGLWVKGVCICDCTFVCVVCELPARIVPVCGLYVCGCVCSFGYSPGRDSFAVVGHMEVENGWSVVCYMLGFVCVCVVPPKSGCVYLAFVLRGDGVVCLLCRGLVQVVCCDVLPVGFG